MLLYEVYITQGIFLPHSCFDDIPLSTLGPAQYVSMLFERTCVRIILDARLGLWVSLEHVFTCVSKPAKLSDAQALPAS